MKIQFLTRGKSKSIYYRVTDGRAGLNMSKILPFKLSGNDKWNSKLQATENNLELNNSLLKYKYFLENEINKLKVDNIDISKNIILNLHNKYFTPVKELETPNPTFKECIDDLIETNNSSVVKGKLRTLKSKVSNIKVIDVDKKWLVNFVKDLESDGFANSSINKSIQLIKQVIRTADENGIPIQRNILYYKALKTSTINHYLNEDEVNQLFKFKASNKALENTRKLFLIGCTTGLRVSDLMRLKSFDISNGMMSLTTKKTKQNIVIPIDPRVSEYIDEVYVTAPQKFNINIKKLLKYIGFDEVLKGYIKVNNRRVLGHYKKHQLITSHAMRRSFATNLYTKLPTPVIMSITGHTTEISFLRYIKKPQSDFAERLKEFYAENMQIE